MKDHGHDQAVEVLARILAQADLACGGEARPEMMEIWAATLMNKFAHFSLETFVLGLREGMMSGKVYGKLNVPQISEWMTTMDTRICDMAEAENTQHRGFDNGGADYLDRMQYATGADKRKLDRAHTVIRELERQLRTEEKRNDDNDAKLSA